MPYASKDKQREYYKIWSKTRGRSIAAKKNQKIYDKARESLEHRKDMRRRYRQANKEKINAYSRKRWSNFRRACINFYSKNKNCCNCCGETIWEFLCIDHIKNDGAEHRKRERRSRSLAGYLVKNNFPSGFQILCHNCNLSKGFYGYCPHSVSVKSE